MHRWNECIVRESDKYFNGVFEFLKIFHKKYNLLKLNSLYFYYLYFIYFTSNLHNFKVNSRTCFISHLLKLNYVFYLLCLGKKLDTYLDMNLRIYFTDIVHLNSNLLKFKSNYFCSNYDLNILSSINYKLMLNLWYFMLYGKYVIYIVTYLYNLYLNTKCYLTRYPLINIALRFLLRSRLEKLIYSKKYKYSKLKFIDKHHIYDIKYKLNVYKNFLFNLGIKQIFYKLNIFKVLNLLSNRKVFMNLNYLWYRFIKINFLYFIYYLNIFNDYDNSLACEYNKFNILGLYSFYWQLNRYGFNVKYYFYYFSTLYFKFFNVADYNHHFYSNLNLARCENLDLFWYKINRIIILNHLRRSFFRYIRLNRFIMRNRLRKKKIIRKWLFYSSIYNMRFFPLKKNLYDEKNINFFILSSKKQIDYLSGANLFSHVFKYSQKYSFSFLNIVYNINIGSKVNDNFYLFQNYLINLVVRKLRKYYYINILNLLCCLKVFYKNTIGKILSPIIYKNDKDLTFYQKKLNLYYFSRFKGMEKFMELYFWKIRWYSWKFEKSIMFNMFVKYMSHFYLFFFSVFSCYVLKNINVFNKIKLSKNNFILSTRLINNIIKKKYILLS